MNANAFLDGMESAYAHLGRIERNMRPADRKTIERHIVETAVIACQRLRDDADEWARGRAWGYAALAHDYRHHTAIYAEQAMAVCDLILDD